MIQLQYSKARKDGLGSYNQTPQNKKLTFEKAANRGKERKGQSAYNEVKIN